MAKRKSRRRRKRNGNKKENRGLALFAIISIVTFVLSGCSNETPEVSDTKSAVGDDEVSLSSEDDFGDVEGIAEIYRDIYDEAADLLRIVARLGQKGYVAVDSENQIDMVGAEQVVDFCKAVDEKKKDNLTIIVVKDFGFQKFDFETENGNVNIVRGYYQFDKNGCLQNRSTVSYPADVWQYTEEGYLLFEGSYFSEKDFILTLNDTPEHTALRVLPLDEKCRELNRKYILPVGYGENNMFLTDWSEEDFGDLDFYDIFDIFYPVLYQQPVPYVADENLGVGAVYQIPEDIFENVIMAHFNLDTEMLRSKTTYFSEDASYEYRPRGFYESEYPDIPYPEVVSYTENQDGTITLIVNAVYPDSNTSLAYSHKTVIRPLNEDCFQYVSNQMLPSSLPDRTEDDSLEEDRDFWWHSNRLTEEEWKEIYGGNCLITEAEKEELNDTALAAAEQGKEVYKNIELISEPSYRSNIKEFTREQCREAVTLLGRAGYVSVTEDTNMENYEKVEDFYAAYMERGIGMIKFTVGVEGMACGMCEAHINEAVRKAFPVKKVTSSHTKKQTVIIAERDIEDQMIKDVIAKTY